ncbi:glycosyl transferase group 1 [Pseudothermotoga thermarum DSM 5069]|uniref:Glycosyl transferase group 1 n=2 Tax=Pseudothermotoga thermarum TaxID=119394 RepID=F7YVK7_9THEM|nr:glycosyl transferase group 1 [Pseudothermotoga thermarum DSM 5069]
MLRNAKLLGVNIMNMKKGIAIMYQNELLSNSLMFKLTKTFSQMGYKVYVVGVSESATSGVIRKEVPLDNVTYFEISSRIKHGLGLQNFWGIFSYVFKAYNVLRSVRNEIQIIYSIDFLMTFVAFLFSCVYSQKYKYVYHIADKFTSAYKVPRILKPIFDFMDILIMKRATKIIVVDDKRIEEIPKQFRHKVEIIYNTPEDIFANETVTPESNFNKSERLKIAYFGLLSEDRFIKQIVEVVMQDEDLELHIGGFGVLEEFVLNASKKCERVVFYGKLSYEQVLKYSKACDLLVAIYDPKIPNNRRASPNKLYEAMMLGKPIIVGKDMGLQHIVEKEKIGLIVNYDADSFKQAILILKSNRQLLTEFSRNARKLYEEKYSWKLMEIRLKKILEDLYCK